MMNLHSDLVLLSTLPLVSILHAKAATYHTSSSGMKVTDTRPNCNVLPPNLHRHSTTNMHSTLVRAQNVFGFFTTVAFCTALLTALSVLLTPQTPSASIELRNVQV